MRFTSLLVWKFARASKASVLKIFGTCAWSTELVLVQVKTLDGWIFQEIEVLTMEEQKCFKEMIRYEGISCASGAHFYTIRKYSWMNGYHTPALCSHYLGEPLDSRYRWHLRPAADVIPFTSPRLPLISEARSTESCSL